MMLLSRTTKARKKRGRCQIWRDKPVLLQDRDHQPCRQKAKKEITKIQGMNRSKNLNSGRFAAAKKLKLWATARKLTEFLFCDNGLDLSNIDATLPRSLVSRPRNTRYYVGIKMGRRQGGPSRTGDRGSISEPIRDRRATRPPAHFHRNPFGPGSVGCFSALLARPV